ncbi:MAG: hypothetical protein ACE5H4_07440 [Candidatus Thorarchaeota archaeon]
MVRTDDTSTEYHSVVNRRVVVIVLSALALFAPMLCYFSGTAINLLALTWRYIQFRDEVYFGILDPLSSIFMMPVLIFRCAYVYQVYKYYQGATTRRRTLVLGIMSEGPGLLMFSLMVIALLFPSLLWLYLSVPTPLLLFAGAAIVLLRPVPELTSPWNGLPSLTSLRGERTG